MRYAKQALEAAGRNNLRSTILRSDLCGCYFCESTFHPSSIVQWTLDDKALCPKCSTEAVIGGEPTKDFLKEMKNHWFNTTGEKQ